MIKTITNQSLPARRNLFRCFSYGKNDIKIGFIGLGNMGGPMAMNIAKSEGFKKNIMVMMMLFIG